MTVGHPLFAALYDRMTRPLEDAWLGERRARLLSSARGDVLDVGAGTGANLPYFQRAARVVALEPDGAMRRRLQPKLPHAAVPAQAIGAAAESLPYPQSSFDAVIFVLALCTVANPAAALAEARRVLKPEGRLFVLEHVRGDGRLADWQDRLAPARRRLVAGCHPNRDTAAAIQRAGFRFEQLEQFHASPEWFITSPMLQAIATPAH
jgi:ubiquinone/menaquinone biosynthesis C-methylase UbiE